MTEPTASRSRPLERFAGAYSATVTAATVLSMASLPAAMLASWRRPLAALHH